MENVNNVEQMDKVNFEMHKSKHEPFMLIKNTEKVRIVAGDSVMSQHEFNTIEEAEEYIDSKPYELIVNLACYATALSIKQTKTKD